MARIVGPHAGFRVFAGDGVVGGGGNISLTEAGVGLHGKSLYMNMRAQQLTLAFPGMSWADRSWLLRFAGRFICQGWLD